MRNCYGGLGYHWKTLIINFICCFRVTFYKIIQSPLSLTFNSSVSKRLSWNHYNIFWFVTWMKWNNLYKASIPNIDQTDYYINVNEGHQFSRRELRELVCINSIYCQIIVGEIKFSPPFQEMKTQFLVRLYKVYCGQHCSVQMREWGILYCWISLSLSLSLCHLREQPEKNNWRLSKFA